MGTVSVVSFAIKTLKDVVVLPIQMTPLGHYSPGCLYGFSVDTSGSEQPFKDSRLKFRYVAIEFDILIGVLPWVHLVPLSLGESCHCGL